MKAIVSIGFIFLTFNSLFSQFINLPFTNGSLPIGWSQNNITFSTGSGGYAHFTSVNSTLTSPVFNAAVACSLEVKFDVAKYGTGTDGPLTIEYSLDGGASWTILGNSTTPVSSTYVSTTMIIPTVSSTMMIRINRSQSTSQKRFRNLVISALGTCGSTSTITTGLVSGGPFTVSCTDTDMGTVSFTSDGTFYSGNTYTAQLSDASGNFASPITIGTLTSIANSGTITISVPSGLQSGSSYKIRLISNNPVIIGSTSDAFSITLTGGPCVAQEPHITSVIYNGCNNATCMEGQSEVVFATTGGYSVATNNPSNVNLNYTAGTSYDLLLHFENATAVTADLNTASGCPGLFVDGISTTIPPHSKLMLVSSAFCAQNYNGWSDLCGEGPIYVLYGRNGTSTTTQGWLSGGNFGNSGGDKTFNLQVTATDGTTYTTNYTYDASGSDGRYAIYGSSYPEGTNPRPPVSNGTLIACSFTPIVLSSELLTFKGNYQNQQSILTWITATEKNNSHFFILRSKDGSNWIHIGRVEGAGNSTQQQHYELIDPMPENGINYYQLFSTDFDGTVSNRGIVAIEVGTSSVYFNSILQTIELSINEVVSIYSADGKLIARCANENSIPFHHKGIFLIHFEESGKTERIVIN